MLILDEPTVGLDPLVQQTLYAELRQVAADGRTVLFSSHTLSEVEALCDRVAIIRSGRLVECATIEEMAGRALRRVEFRLNRDGPGGLEFPDGLIAEKGANGVVTGSWRGRADRLVTWLATLDLADVTIGAPNLEDLFAAYYQEETQPDRLEPKRVD